MEPDERRVPEIAQANSFPLRQRMTLRHGDDHSVQGELLMLKVLVPRSDSRSKPGVQSI